MLTSRSLNLILNFQDIITYSSKLLISDKDWVRWLDEDLVELMLPRKYSNEPSDLERFGQHGEIPRKRLTLL